MNATTVKGACPLCAGHVELEAEMIGQAMSCPHCGKEVAFRPLAWADRRSAEEEAGKGRNGTEGTKGPAVGGKGTMVGPGDYRERLRAGTNGVVLTANQVRWCGWYRELEGLKAQSETARAEVAAGAKAQSASSAPAAGRMGNGRNRTEGTEGIINEGVDL